jgi:tetratricopeptide (TPR) repeat protein
LNSPNADSHAALSVAMAYQQMQNWPKLETTLEKLVKIMPDNPEAWYDLAAFKAGFGKPAEAIPALRQAIQLSNQRLVRDPKARNLLVEARKDGKFNAIQQLPEFKQLVSAPPMAEAPAH